MFKFLKDKLKGAISKFSDDIDKEAEDIKEEVVEEVLEDVPEDTKEVSEEKKGSIDIKKAEQELSADTISPKEEEKLKLDAEKKLKAEKENQKAEEAKKKKEEEELLDVALEDKKEEPKEEKKEEPESDEKESKKGFFGKMKDKFGKKEDTEEVLEVKEEKEEKKTEVKPEDLALPTEVKKAEEEEEKPKKGVVDELLGDISSDEIKEDEPLPEITSDEETIPEPPVVEPIKEEPKPELPEEPEAKEEKKGFFKKLTETVTKKKLSESKFDDLFWELEVVLLENNLAVEVIEKIKNDLKVKLVDQKLTRGRIEEEIMTSLAKSISQLFDVETFDIIEKVKTKKPYVIAFIGVNGSGKTTTIAKMIKLFQDNNLRCVVAASDTFRAAAIQQLEEHTDKLNVKLIKHDYGADPAAVAYDAIEHAKAKDIDVVMIDTAGRLHSNTNLMDEMKKIIRVAKPDMNIFIGESITGNDCVEQAKQFDAAIGIDAMILSKADVDEKGGAAISVSYVTGKPILFIGTGQGYSDLKKFDKKLVLDTLGM